MTIRQVQAQLEAINIRTHNEVAINAKIHGLDAEMKQKTRSEPLLNEEELEEIKKEHSQIFKQKFELRKGKR